ncbi:MAG: hypothetical protein U7126_11210 [Microcoleus sp.]
MEPVHKDLLQQIARLSENYPNLADRLLQAAQQLQNSGIPPSESLLAEIATYSRNFAVVQKQALKMWPSSVQSPSEIASLKDIQNLVEMVAASEGKAEIRSQALKVLDRVLAIAHREQSDFAPLQSVHTKARELYRAISESTPTQLHSDAESLVSGKHPVSAVLALVAQQDKLDDEQWVILEEIVSASFGKQLAVAIFRGKLTVAEIEEPAQLEPAFKAAAVEPKISAQPLPEVIVIPSGNVAPPKQVVVRPEIKILESPSPSAPVHEVIIVPSIEIPQSRLTTISGNIVFGEPPRTQQVQLEGALAMKVLVHIQGIGDRTFGAMEYAGTRAQGRRIEGFEISIDPPIPGLSVQYMAHVEGVGDTPWINEGELAGFRGQAKRIEGFAVRLSGPEAANYNVFYTAHIQNVGDTEVSSNGEYCGTRGKGLRVEGLKVWIVRSASAAQPVAPVGLKVLAHIQGIGDRTFSDREYAGTRAQGRRVEGFQIKIEPPVAGLNLQYMAHVEGVGDTAWISEGDLAGFRGKAKRIEGFAVRLTGSEADKYDVFYTAHIQNVGDTPVTANGQYCGTRGKGLRVEGVTVWVEAKG